MIPPARHCRIHAIAQDDDRRLGADRNWSISSIFASIASAAVAPDYAIARRTIQRVAGAPTGRGQDIDIGYLPMYSVILFSTAGSSITRTRCASVQNDLHCVEHGTQDLLVLNGFAMFLFRSERAARLLGRNDIDRNMPGGDIAFQASEHPPAVDVCKDMSSVIAQGWNSDEARQPPSK